MAYLCDLCGKGIIYGNNVSHSNNRTKRKWKPNIKSVRHVQNGATKRIYVCTSCIKAGKVIKPIKAARPAV